MGGWVGGWVGGWINWKYNQHSPQLGWVQALAELGNEKLKKIPRYLGAPSPLIIYIS